MEKESSFCLPTFSSPLSFLLFTSELSFTAAVSVGDEVLKEGQKANDSNIGISLCFASQMSHQAWMTSLMIHAPRLGWPAMRTGCWSLRSCQLAWLTGSQIWLSGLRFGWLVLWLGWLALTPCYIIYYVPLKQLKSNWWSWAKELLIIQCPWANLFILYYRLLWIWLEISAFRRTIRKIFFIFTSKLSHLMRSKVVLYLY